MYGPLGIGAGFMMTPEQREKVATRGLSETAGIAGVPITISGIKKLSRISNQISNKLLRDGIPKEEVTRIEKEYGSSNGALIDQVKNKVNNFVTQANSAYRNIINSFKFRMFPIRVAKSTRLIPIPVPILKIPED